MLFQEFEVDVPIRRDGSVSASVHEAALAIKNITLAEKTMETRTLFFMRFPIVG